ncbi:Psathyrella Velutina lectin At 1.5a resolution [Lyophyllum atratum]|nr:Psathyrella Velutina lectin At 1.5a resolution [Lyophyllum atratum]
MSIVNQPSNTAAKLRKKLVISESIPVPTASPGTADIIGFGSAGVVVLRNSLNAQKSDASSVFGYSSGWRVEKHVRLLADTTGNGRLDIVGFGESAVLVALNHGDNTFENPQIVSTEFTYAAGWRVEKHIRFMADIRNTGRADIVGFGDSGVYISFNNGNGLFGPAKLVVNSFGHDAGGWSREKHPRFLADINGNGLLDIIGFGEDTVWIATNNGDGTFQPVIALSQGLCYNSGWRVENHPRFIVDLTGDGRPDLVGFGDAGVHVAFNSGNGTFQPVRKVYDSLCYNDAWRVDKHPRFVADLTGNGCGDLIGFGDNGVSVAINNGDGTFQGLKRVSEMFGFNISWRVEKHPRFVADLTGDGRPDIIGFGDQAVYAVYNDGKGNFGPSKELIHDFGSQQAEWSSESSVRYVANLYH